MRLFNSTPLSAKAQVSLDRETEMGLGTVAAKATFVFDVHGRTELDTQAPFSLLAQDEETPLGVLPADQLARRGEKFEVMLLGHAYAAGRRPRAVVRVGLSIGNVRRQIDVFGDRAWTGNVRQSPRITNPVPFERMPLTWERAFGGTWPVNIDRDTVLDVFDPTNKRGRGFDAELWADGVAKMLGVPPGYPVLPGYLRRLPNLENPHAPIERWTDTPEPVGWAPSYPDIFTSQLHILRRETARVERMKKQGQSDPEKVREAALADPDPDPDSNLYRAHSDWVIDTPPADATVRLENLVPDAPVVEFPLPRLRVVSDYVLYERQGERELRPHAIVLLPDRKTFCITYRMPFTFQSGPAAERAFRLRTTVGWFGQKDT